MIKYIIQKFKKIIAYNSKSSTDNSFTENIKNSFNNLDKLAKTIMKNGLKLCSIFAIIALFLLVAYNFNIDIPILFSIGFLLFKFSIIFGVEFIICGFAADKIKSELI